MPDCSARQWRVKPTTPDETPPTEFPNGKEKPSAIDVSETALMGRCGKKKAPTPTP
tara:strand:- start:144059 stop:144226 length:168 start_codon:yes stop_codon:yes gene_type:complete